MIIEYGFNIRVTQRWHYVFTKEIIYVTEDPVNQYFESGMQGYEFLLLFYTVILISWGKRDLDKHHRTNQTKNYDAIVTGWYYINIYVLGKIIKCIAI